MFKAWNSKDHGKLYSLEGEKKDGKKRCCNLTTKVLRTFYSSPSFMYITRIGFLLFTYQ